MPVAGTSEPPTSRSTYVRLARAVTSGTVPTTCETPGESTRGGRPRLWRTVEGVGKGLLAAELSVAPIAFSDRRCARSRPSSGGGGRLKPRTASMSWSRSATSCIALELWRSAGLRHAARPATGAVLPLLYEIITVSLAERESTGARLLCVRSCRVLPMLSGWPKVSCCAVKVGCSGGALCCGACCRCFRWRRRRRS